MMSDENFNKWTAVTTDTTKHQIIWNILKYYTLNFLIINNVVILINIDCNTFIVVVCKASFSSLVVLTTLSKLLSLFVVSVKGRSKYFVVN